MDTLDMDDELSVEEALLSDVALAYISCVESFENFIDLRIHDKDHYIPLVKLDFERNKLLIWGDVVGILGKPTECALWDWTDSETGRIALTELKHELQNITDLLVDREKLQNDYGLRAWDETNILAGWSAISQSNLDIFKPLLKRFLMRNWQQIEDRKKRISSKGRWAILDAKKLQGLINEVQDGVDKILLIRMGDVPPVSAARLDDYVRINISLIVNLADL
jgi:hypothetical protein